MARRFSNMRRCVWIRPLALTLFAAGVMTGGPSLSAAPPHFDARARTTEYTGPGREAPDPAHVDQVLFGYFGPSQPGSYDVDLYLAAQLAIADANAAGGYRGIPFHLRPAWSENRWGTGVGQVTQMVYQTGVWALIGGPDGPSTHLAEQVVAKARLVLLSPASTDTTAHRANVPWIFSCLPGNHLLAPPLVDHMADVVGTRSLAVAVARDHDSRHLMAEISRRLTALQTVPQVQYVFDSDQVNVQQLAAQLTRSQPSAIIVVANPPASAELVRALRRCGFAGLIVGGPAMGRRQFVALAGDVAGPVVFPLLWQANPRGTDFAARFRALHGIHPDHAAAASYDAIQLLATAIGKTGLNRARIGDAVRALSPYQGVSGVIRWDPLGENRRRVPLGTIRRGRVVPCSEAQRQTASPELPILAP